MKMIYRLLAVLLFGSGLAAAQVPGFFSSINANTGTVPVFNSVVYSSGYSTIETAAAACSANPCQIMLVSSLAQSTSGTYTLPGGVVIEGKGGGSINLASGQVLNFGNSPSFNGPSVQFFTGAGSVSGLINGVRPEWWGAIGWATKSLAESGSDATAALQAAINAIASGGQVILSCRYYRVTAPINFTTSTSGMHGTCQGYGNPAGATASTIVNTTAGANTISISGSNWNQFADFALARSVLPTGTASGMIIHNTNGVRLNSIVSMDSVYDFHLIASNTTVMNNCGSGWGFEDVTGYPSGNIIGLYLDSSAGVASESDFIQNFAVANNAGVTPTTIGLDISGSAINDVNSENLATAGTSFGVYISYTAGGSGGSDSAADIHIDRPTLDNCLVTCVSINNVEGTVSFPSVTVNNGYFDTNNGGTLVDIETSVNVSINGNMGFAPGGSGAKGILVNNSESISVQNNTLLDMNNGAYFISNNNGTNCVISGNTLTQNIGTSISVGISLTGTTSGCVLDNNSFVADTSSNGPIGISLASGAQNNQIGFNTFNTIGTSYSGLTTQKTTVPNSFGAATLTDGTCSMHAGTLTGCATAGATPRTCNANGCYKIDADGTVRMWGIATGPTSGSGVGSITGSFSLPFTCPTVAPTMTIAVGTNPAGSGSGNDNDTPPSIGYTAISTSGASYFAARVVQASAGGGNFAVAWNIDWTATCY